MVCHLRSTALWVAFLWCQLAFASDKPELAQRNAEQNYLPKVDFACSTQLAIHYDSESLNLLDHNIREGVADGENECNEPLRYLWYACQTPAGKNAVKAAKLSKIECKGVPGKRGALRVQGGTITVERAFEEPRPYLRSRAQFEAALGVKLLALRADDDPYHDSRWQELKRQPDPILLQKNYCTSKAERRPLSEQDSLLMNTHDGEVTCFEDGQSITAVTIKADRRTGFVTRKDGEERVRSTYRDSAQAIEERRYARGVLRSMRRLRQIDGKARDMMDPFPDPTIASATYYPNGKLERYEKRIGVGLVWLGRDGKLLELRCEPDSGQDEELRAWCGFPGPVTHTLYNEDGTARITQTWKVGVLVRQVDAGRN